MTRYGHSCEHPRSCPTQSVRCSWRATVPRLLPDPTSCCTSLGLWPFNFPLFHQNGKGVEGNQAMRSLLEDAKMRLKLSSPPVHRKGCAVCCSCTPNTAVLQSHTVSSLCLSHTHTVTQSAPTAGHTHTQLHSQLPLPVIHTHSHTVSSPLPVIHTHSHTVSAVCLSYTYSHTVSAVGLSYTHIVTHSQLPLPVIHTYSHTVSSLCLSSSFAATVRFSSLDP